MRLFLAIELSDEIKRKVESDIDALRKDYPDFRWVPWENYHIVIQFFGETNSYDKMKKIIEDLVFDKESFYLYSTNVNLFLHNNITIYLNFRREKKLENLAETVKKSLITESKDSKRFIPHLTLARCRIPSKQQYFVLKKRLEKIRVDVEFPVKKIALFKSVLLKTFVYKKLIDFSLI